MKKKRFTEAQIVSILHQQEVGKSVKDISRENGISDATFYSLPEVRQMAHEWQQDYNYQRPHELLGNVPPVEFINPFP